MSYKRSMDEKNKLVKLYIETRNKYGSGVWFDEKTNRYKRYSMSYKSDYPKRLKRLCNKKIRKYDGDLKRNDYRKISEYQWMLF